LNLNNQIIPIWKTHASVGKSILTYEDEEDISDSAPVSVIAIAKKHNLKQLIVIDNSFLAFPNLYKACKKHEIQLIFGLNFTICNDVAQKDEASLSNNCRVSVLMKNSNGYKDLIKLNDAINGSSESFYYTPRGDWNVIKKYMTDNLLLMIPPHNNFIHINLLRNGKSIPDFGNLKPIMTFCNIELPYTQILNPAIKTYAQNNNFELQEVWPVYYYKKDDFKAYSTFRAIHEREKFNSPNIDFFTNPEFCIESYLERSNLKNTLLNQ
jgi:DNA polymerase III alpha subunit